MTDLQKALETLETFIQQIENEKFPNLSRFEVRDGMLVAKSYTSLEKIIHLACSIASDPHEKEKIRSGVINEVLHSSDVLKSYSSLFHHLEEGNEEQKKFAAKAKDAIHRFNKIIDQSRQKPPSIRKRIVRFIYEKSGFLIGKRLTRIDLAPKATMRIDFTTKAISSLGTKKLEPNLYPLPTTIASVKVSAIRDAVIPLSQVANQTLELYFMKVISMLEKRGGLSNSEARVLVQQGIRQVSVDKQNLTVTLSQELIPIPGHSILVSGAFRRDSRTLVFNIPIQESFQLSIRSTQTGFPHPLQHNGWALHDALIPACLHRPEQLILFPILYECKKKTAQALLQQAPLPEKAKTLLQMKSQAFERSKTEFLALHHTLALAIGASANKQTVPSGFEESMGMFFTYLQNQPHSFEGIAWAYQAVMNICIARPYEIVHKKWLENHFKNPSSVFREVENVLMAEFNQALKELPAFITTPYLPFCNAMAEIFSQPARLLILQHQSEIMKFAPPELDLFSKKVQAALYLQLWEFQHELSLNIHQIDMTRRLHRLLEDDITLFKTENLSGLSVQAVKVVGELEQYYVERLSGSES